MTNEPDGAAEKRHWLARPLPRIALVLLLVFLALQLVPIRVDNHPVTVEPNWDSPRTEALFAAACADCHSNQASSAWYEKVAPVSWWIKGHVDEGREALNVSECGTGRGENVEEDESIETIREGEMPPSYYTMFGLHSGAKLSAAEKDELVAGLTATAALGCRNVP